MQSYLKLLQDILDNGEEKADRTGTGTLSVFGRQLRFPFKDGFPLLTTKQIHIKSVVHELLWFISGETNIGYLQQNGVTIWDEWADENGELGNVYGHQWRAWKTAGNQQIDQLARVLSQIKRDPNSRRLLVNAWNVGELDSMALPPCHYAYQFWVNRGRLSCMFNMRSVDVFLGLPFNIASYALLTAMVADQTDLEPYEVIWCGGDVHLYKNHLSQAREQLGREPYPLPKLSIIRKAKDLYSYRYEDFVFEGYIHHPHIAAPISV